jgi:K+-sensing histidine kinase KdpD
MSRNQSDHLIVGVLALLTLLSVLVSFQAASPGLISERLVELVIYASLTAFALIFSVPLPRSELSIAHAIGMMAMLSLPAEVIPDMSIALFLGGILGAVGHRQLRHRQRNEVQPNLYAIVHMTARVTLSYFAAGYLYKGFFNGTLPISTSSDFAQLLPVLGFALVYVILYFASFVLQLVTDRKKMVDIVVENALVLGVILLLPVPFAYMGASVARMDDSPVLFSITVIGTMLIIFGLYVLNRSQQQLRRQLDELHSISVATRSMRGYLELDGLLRTIYVQVSQLLDTLNFTVVLQAELEGRVTFPLVIRGGQELEVTESHGLPDDYALIAHVMKTGNALLIDDDVSHQAAQLGIRPPQKSLLSWLAVPIVMGNETIGAFVIQSYEQRHFDENDLRVLSIIVSSASIAIENARLYHQKSSHAEQLALLNQVMVLLTGTLAPDTVMETVVSSATTISDASAVGIFLFAEDKKNELELAYCAGLSDAFRYRPAMPLLSKKLIESQGEYIKPAPILAPNLDYTTKTSDLIHKRILDEGKHAFIEHPLILGGKNLGVLVLYFDKPQVFHPEHVDLIQAFVTQAAQAITNAQRFASTNKTLEYRIEQLHVLAAMGRLLNATMEPDQIYNVVLTYTTDATKAPRGLIAIYQQANQLEVVSQRDYPEKMFADASFLEQGLTGQVLQSGQAVRIEDTRHSTRYLPLVPGTRSMLITPIMKGHNILGIIVLESDSPYAFSESDAQFVAQITNQAVIGIDNTMLFQRIREARDNMQVMLNAMEEGIILIDYQGDIALANPRVDLVQLTAADIVQQAVKNLLENPELGLAKKFGFNNNEAVLKLLQQMAGSWENYAPHDYEMPSREFGTRYIQRQIIPVYDENRKPSAILLVFYNKSEEHELAASRESFSQMIVHDLRSPLTAVTTSLRLLEELVPKDSDFAKVVEKTTTASRRALRKVLTRVSTLLDISKIESGEIYLDREPTALYYLIENVHQELKPLADELGVTIKYNRELSLPLLDIDADKVERVVLNLVDNALKYSPENSVIEIRVIKADPDFLRLEVVDEGPGIPDEYKRRLFDRFVQIEGRKTVRHGVGLGLSFCKLVTEAHGGEIWVADNPEGGSIFKVMLPIADLPELVE